MEEKVFKSLNSGLKELRNSFYNKDLKKIICGKCLAGFKLRKSGAAKTLVNYFQENHFSVCGMRESKRKAKDDAKDIAEETKKRKLEKMDSYWSSLRKKSVSEPDKEVERDEDEELFADPDLIVPDEDEALAIAGPSTTG